MGIGNVELLRWGVEDIARSLPLMGIGNKGRKAPLYNCDTSLPLMGIGNTARPTRGPLSSTTHYPSWGSETIEIARVFRVPPHNSLPLMGIGKPNYGDRHGVGIKHSLPLMGIGNAGRPGRGLHRLPLPSWGSGTAARSPRAGAWAGPSHYPSWGIGNWSARCRLGSPSTTHYPSWGSGTRCHRPKRRSPPPHYPSWGSGTLWPGSHGPSVCVLQIQSVMNTQNRCPDRVFVRLSPEALWVFLSGRTLPRFTPLTSSFPANCPFATHLTTNCFLAETGHLNVVVEPVQLELLGQLTQIARFAKNPRSLHPVAAGRASRPRQ